MHLTLLNSAQSGRQTSAGSLLVPQGPHGWILGSASFVPEAQMGAFASAPKEAAEEPAANGQRHPSVPADAQGSGAL